MSRYPKPEGARSPQDSPAILQSMNWRIHTGPFPYMVQGHSGELWLWRITDGDHHTSITVAIELDGDVTRSDLAPQLREAVDTRGEGAVLRSLAWEEPPREITFRMGSDEPEYWGGKP